MMQEPSPTEPKAVQQDSAKPEEAGRELPPAARRALEEAAERRAAVEAEGARAAKEIGGRGGKDPARYGDWEIKGKAVDF